MKGKISIIFRISKKKYSKNFSGNGGHGIHMGGDDDGYDPDFLMNHFGHYSVLSSHYLYHLSKDVGLFHFVDYGCLLGNNDPC